MTDAELEVLLADLESDRVERKSSASDHEKIRETVCAFANDLPNHQLPGVIFVGAKDDGSCAGLNVTDELLRALAGIRDEGKTLPFPFLTVQKKTLRGCEMAVVTVEPSDAPPVRFRGRIWIRVGPRLAVATAEEERRLTEKRRSKDAPFDIRPWRPATIDDLDMDLFRRTYLPASVAPEALAENQRTEGQQLASLRMTGGGVPTVVGVLVLATDPLAFLPGAYVQFRRIDGTGMADPVRDAAMISGPLSELLRGLEEKLVAHIETSRDFSSSTVDIARPDYPFVALQQLTRNAILHRTYEGTNAPVRISWFSDRIEIHSPGGPYGQVTKANFGQPDATDYRNPYLAEAMRNLGYVQKFGVGIALARREMEKNGNPPLEHRVEDNAVLAILRRRP
jgi:ATP-dependent DNA helicase RecG